MQYDPEVTREEYEEYQRAIADERLERMHDELTNEVDESEIVASIPELHVWDGILHDNDSRDDSRPDRPASTTGDERPDTRTGTKPRKRTRQKPR